MSYFIQRSKKKEDFGVVLGCKIYIKEIIPKTVADKDGILKEGDELTKINGSLLDSLNLKEAKKILDGCKDKLDLTVKRSNLTTDHMKSAPMTNGFSNESKNNLMKNGIPVPPRPPLPSGKFAILQAFFQMSIFWEVPLILFIRSELWRRWSLQQKLLSRVQRVCKKQNIYCLKNCF